MGYGEASDLLSNMGVMRIERGRYIIDKRRFFTKYPHLDYYVALAAMMGNMVEEGYLRERLYNGAGWIYEVIRE
jgi:hypothetical protein